MKKSLVLCALLVAPAAMAWDCKHSKQIEMDLDLSGSESLTVNAKAGDLDVKGIDGDTARIRGTACVSDEDWLEQVIVNTEDGENAEITVDLPNASGWSITGNRYAYLDLEVSVPKHLALVVNDSSGDAEIEGVGSVTVKDSSGDLDIENVEGWVVVEDSSGDIEIEDVKGDVTIPSDSSGDIEIESVTGNVLIERDSSGGIYIADVSENVMVERDSSGDIEADGVGGDFTVKRDGSGDIRARNVTGTVSKPE